MSSQALRFRAIKPDDKDSGFECGVKALDDYFLKHAHTNHEADVGRAYVLEASTSEIESGLPTVLGFYTLSMASVISKDAASVLGKKLPRYPMPAALIGRLAVDHRAQGNRLGEKLLADALERVYQASEIIACIGVIVDAKDSGAEHFYSKYDFVSLEASTWPRRMFLPLETIREALTDE